MLLAKMDEMARTIAKGLYCEQTAFCRHLTWLLARGQPVSPEQVATTLHRSRGEVMQTLRQLPDLAYDEAGRIVGNSLSLVPTPHHFEANGHALFTWGALDILMYPVILKLPARVESACPVTGTRIRLTVMPERLAHLEPESAVVSIILPETSGGCRWDRGTFCHYGHFFRSQEVASTWQASHQDAILLPVAEAY